MSEPYTPTDDEMVETIKAALWAATPDDGYKTEEDRAEADPWLARDAAAVLPIVRAQQAEAWEAWASRLADHLDGATPRAWGFHHPCDPPGVRWEPTERDRALMDVADMVRNDTRNPYRETGASDERR